MSRLKRKKQQIKRIASEKIEPVADKPTDGQRRRKTEIEPISKHYKTVVYAFFAVVVIGVTTLVLVLALRKDKDPEPVKRFEDLIHVNINHYKVFTNEDGFGPVDLNEEDKEVYDDIDLKKDIYIYVYNPDYDVCKDCETLDSFIKNIYNDSTRSYTILVMDFTKNGELLELLPELDVSLRPALLYIDGDTYKEVFTDVNSIKLELRK